MSEFLSKIVSIGPQGSTPLEPVEFAGRLTEKELEDQLAAAPNLLGEELLILGRQLIDFAEDNKRLDLLAVDTEGEIVLIELKVDNQFAFTDLQALGYAGAYADRPITHFAETLMRSCSSSGDASIRTNAGLVVDADLDASKGAIASFLDLADFEEWNPSKQIRIKLVAPGFPRRVLSNVKWLGDVYGLAIEAIRAQLFEFGDQLQVYFERLLPLPGAEDFDLSIREREETIRRENKQRRKAVFSLLVNNGVLVDGDRLWLIQSALPSPLRETFESGHVAFSGVVDAGQPRRLVWRPTEEDEPRSVSPARLAYEAYTALTGEDIEVFFTAVAENFTHEDTGKTLEELALEAGLWE